LRPSARRWAVPVALAASVALAAIGLHYSLGSGRGATPAIAYSTANGEQRSITLGDGSTVRLDVGSEMLVRMTTERRDIVLLAGRAYFEVAHDAGRPFAVKAAGSRTTALGTRFQVERDRGRVVVTLAEGSVAVDNESSGARGPEWQERLQPGEQLRIGANMEVHSKQRVDPQVAISWTRGRHVFRGTPLAEALDEVNRYAATKVRLGDPSLAGLEVAGSFIAGDSEAIVAAFAAVLPLRSVAAGEKEIILFRRYDAADQ
jgi:transmembrane sensor